MRVCTCIANVMAAMDARSLTLYARICSLSQERRPQMPRDIPNTCAKCKQLRGPPPDVDASIMPP
jgi:hypothetical protein